MDRMNKEQLIKLIKTIKVDKTEFWLLSSSSLVMRNIYPDAGDLDIAVTEKGLEQLMKNYNLIPTNAIFYSKVKFAGLESHSSLTLRDNITKFVSQISTST